MATLLECIDDLGRIKARARLLELALLHTDEAGEGVYGEAIAQQAQDVANQLGELMTAFKSVNMAPGTLNDLLRELEEVHALQIPDDDHDDEENRYKRNWSLREKIDATPARTIDELKVKARAAQIALERDVDHSNDGLGSFANLAQSICRDIDAIASADGMKVEA
jgi:hypothetical protein